MEEHITNTFGTLIPDEQFAVLVDTPVKDFTWTQDNSGYGSRQELKSKITPFQFMVWTTLKPLVEERFKAYFEETGKPGVLKFFDELINLPGVQQAQVDRATSILLQMTASLFQNVVVKAKQEVKSEIGTALNNAQAPTLAGAVWGAPNFSTGEPL